MAVLGRPAFDERHICIIVKSAAAVASAGSGGVAAVPMLLQQLVQGLTRTATVHDADEQAYRWAVEQA